MGDLTLFEALTGGAFDRLNWQHSGEFDQNFSKKSNAPGFARGGGGMGGFGIDWYIKENYKRSMDSFYQNFSSLFANQLKLHSRQYSICFCGKGGLLNIGIADVWQESQSL